MKKSFFIVLICVCLLLACCNSSNQDSVNSQSSVQETEHKEVKEYPDLIDTEEVKLLTPLIPDEVFYDTVNDGLVGTLYKQACWVEEYIYDENGAIDAYRVSTHMGDIIVADLYQKMISEASNDEDFSTLDTDLFRSYIPIPPKDELVWLFVEYRGMSTDFGYEYDCPFFIYGSADYLAKAMAYSVDIPDETTPEEIQDTIPSVTEPEPTEETQTITQYGAGMYKVGVDLPAGEYLFFANDRYSAYVCASTDSNQDDIIENEVFDYTFFMTVEDGQYLQANRCVFVEASSTTVEINADGSLPEGMYRVGIDIPAGEYKLTADDSIPGYWCTYNSTAIPFDIEDNDNFEGSTYVTVTDGQYLIINRCTAEPKE